MNALAGSPAPAGASAREVAAVEAWRRQAAAEAAAYEPLPGSTKKGGYGAVSQRSFPPSAPADNMPVTQLDRDDAQAGAGAARSTKHQHAPAGSDDDDDWANVRAEYSKKATAGDMLRRLPAHAAATDMCIYMHSYACVCACVLTCVHTYIRRLPAHALMLMTVAAIVSACLLAVWATNPAPSDAAGAAAQKQLLHKAEAAQARAAAHEVAERPLTAAQETEMKTKAAAQARLECRG